MMDYYDQIEEYLNNALSEVEKIAFEEAMRKDEQLRAAVESHGAAMDVVGSILEGEVRGIIDNEELKIGDKDLMVDDEGDGKRANGKLEAEGGKLSGVEVEEGVRKGANVRRMIWIRWVAAAVVVLLLGWWGMDRFNNKMDIEDEIFAKFYTPLPTLGTKSNGKLRSKLDSALYYYDIRDFDRSRELFETFIPEDTNDTIAIHLTHLYFLDRNYTESKKMLNIVSDSSSLTTGKKELQLYLALIEKNDFKVNSIFNTMSESEQKRLMSLLK